MALSKITNASVSDNAVHGRRNLIYNGSAQVNQRGAIAAGATDAYFADRWSHIHNGTAARSALNTSTDVPTDEGFSKSLKIDVTTADTTPTGTNYMILRQVLEGQDLVRLKKGTSSAEKLTLSFWVKSSVTGTYIAELFDLHNSRQISKAYTVSTANTWEKKTITFPADTSGAFTYDNSGGLSVQWWLLAGGDFTSGTLNDSAWAASTNANRVVGQVNLFASTSNEFYLTGIQLEIGSESSPFEHRSYGEELELCKRYYQTINSLSGYFFPMVRHTASANYYSGTHYFSPELRASASVIVNTSGTFIHKPSRRQDSGSLAGNVNDKHQVTLFVNPSTNDSDAYVAYMNHSVTVDAEL